MKAAIRVLQCTHSWLDVTENWCFRLISAMPASETHILSRDYIPGSPWRSEFRSHRWPLNFAENGRQKLRIKVFNQLLRGLRPFEDRVLAASLRGQVDILHAHFATLAWDHLRLAELLSVPMVISFYGFDYESLPYGSRSWKRRYHTLFRRAALLICEGNHGVRTLNRQGCPLEKLAIVRLGVDVERIVFPLQHTRPRRLRVIQLARLAEKKGHADAIKAVAMAAKEIPIEFEIVGSELNVTRGELRELAEALGVGHLVKFKERIEFDTMYEYLQGFDVFLQPSRYASDRDCEGGAPVALLDAQAVGLPVISTKHCDIPDEVVDGVTGFLSEEGDIAKLAESLIRISGMSDEAYEAMRRAGRRHIETMYSIGENARVLRGHYAAALAAKN